MPPSPTVLAGMSGHRSGLTVKIPCSDELPCRSQKPRIMNAEYDQRKRRQPTDHQSDDGKNVRSLRCREIDLLQGICPSRKRHRPRVTCPALTSTTARKSNSSSRRSTGWIGTSPSLSTLRQNLASPGRFHDCSFREDSNRSRQFPHQTKPQEIIPEVGPAAMPIRRTDVTRLVVPGSAAHHELVVRARFFASLGRCLEILGIERTGPFQHVAQHVVQAVIVVAVTAGQR